VSSIYRIPLVRPFLPSFEELEWDVREMLDTGRLSNFGPFSKRLECVAQDQLRVNHALAVSSATTGLCLVLNTLPAGTEVILLSFTFIATAQAVIWNRLIPVFADVQPDTLNVCPNSIRTLLTDRTSAIVAVHVFGSPCDNETLARLASENGVRLFFDSAHAFGSSYRGSYVGAHGDAEVFSLSATKVVPSGEGGLVTTNSEYMNEAILDRRNYGLKDGNSKDCHNDGLNGRLPEFSAILALKEIDSLAWRVARRNEIAAAYREFLAPVPGLRFQIVRDGNRSTFKDFTIQVDPDEFGATRDQLRASLASRGIESVPYFWPSIHVMQRFKQHKPRVSLHETNRVSNQILSLPIFEAMNDVDICDVAQSIVEFHDAVRSGAQTSSPATPRETTDAPVC
jgi:dTDP-4-amino-4,6-dideoxygalactose transaminase